MKKFYLTDLCIPFIQEVSFEQALSLRKGAFDLLLLWSLPLLCDSAGHVSEDQKEYPTL